MFFLRILHSLIAYINVIKKLWDKGICSIEIEYTLSIWLSVDILFASSQYIDYK